MPYRLSFVAVVLLAALSFSSSTFAQGERPNCPSRPINGQPVLQPPSLSSQNGVLQLGLILKSQVGLMNYPDYCLDYVGTSLGFVEAPALRLNPGDLLIMDLANGLTPPAPEKGSPVPPSESAWAAMPMNMSAHNASDPDADCNGHMSPVATNMHFHGLNVPPVCHQDDVLNTLIQPGDPPFEYRITIPANDAPGLFWYHPHPHGNTTVQVNGGAAGAIIINGMEKVRPEVAGLPERLLILRQQFPNTQTWVPGPFEFTLNFQPCVLPPPRIVMKPGQKEFWRFVNASSQGFLNLVVLNGNIPFPLELIAIDGVPLKKVRTVRSIPLAPAQRAEFIVKAPPAGFTAVFETLGVNTGAVGNVNPVQELALISTTDTGGDDLPRMPLLSPRPAPPSVTPRFSGLLQQTPTAVRQLYFSESGAGINGPNKYYLTLKGDTPHTFSMDSPPAIRTTIGAVEDWIIENRAQESHAFHIHQLHFLVLEQNGVRLAEPYLADTITLPYWSGSGPYPSVTLRMDFRDPDIAGTFVYHCHILQHEDNGMMAKIEVDPAR